MSNKHCRQLSNGYKINIDHNNNLLWSPCCFYATKVNLEDTVNFQKELAFTSSATGWLLPECSICKQMEETSVDRLSPRINSFVRVPEEFDDGDCVDLEISFDTTCNAACMSCGSYSSSTWTKFERKHNLLGKLSKDSYHSPASADYFLQKLIKLVPLDKLRTIFILGGEPFYSDTHIKLLEHVCSVHPNPELITLRYVSNGSIFPESNVIELWSKFKEIHITFSLDGILNKFEYLRWPLTWNKVVNVIDKFINETNVIIGINSTISPLNVLYWQELDDWTNATVPKDRLARQGTRPNRCFGYMDLHYTPLLMREEFYKQYGLDHKVSRILMGLEVNDNNAKMISYLDKIDPLRNQSWRETFPDVVKFFER